MLDNFKLSEYLVSNILDILDHTQPVDLFSIDWKPFYLEEVWFERKDRWDRWRPLQPGPCPGLNQFSDFLKKSKSATWTLLNMWAFLSNLNNLEFESLWGDIVLSLSHFNFHTLTNLNNLEFESLWGEVVLSLSHFRFLTFTLSLSHLHKPE